MRFAQVIGVLHSVEDGYRIVVTLDTRLAVQTIRDEIITQLMRNGGREDADWTVDQLTQETIGTTLAEQGWEVVAQQAPADDAGWAPPMASYLVRS